MGLKPICPNIYFEGPKKYKIKFISPSSNFKPYTRGLTGVSVQRVLIRSALTACGITYATDPANQGAVLIKRTDLTLERVREFLGLLLAIPIEDPVPEDVRQTLEALARPATHELVRSFSNERLNYKEVFIYFIQSFPKNGICYIV